MVTTWIGELLIGEGFWLGLILIVSILTIVTYISNMFKVMAFPLCLILALYYYQNIPSNDFRIWGIIFISFFSVFLLLMPSKR